MCQHPDSHFHAELAMAESVRADLDALPTTGHTTRVWRGAESGYTFARCEDCEWNRHSADAQAVIEAAEAHTLDPNRVTNEAQEGTAP